MTAFKLKTTLVAASSVLALGLAGCREDDRAAIAVPDPTPAAFLAGPMAELPYAEPAPVNWYGPDEGYRWAERAYGMQRAFYETPPDYAFDYGGYQPWVWETADDWAMYAEPWDDGYRYYYYEPGAQYPYFVRDGLYGYGFDPLGALVALFDADGDYLPIDYYDDMAPLAGRYYHQGYRLRTAGLNAAPIYIDEPVWIERAPLILASTDPWIRAASQDDAWRTWRQRTGEQELKRFWKEEKRREKEAAKWARQIRRDEAFAQRYAAYEPRAFAPVQDGRAFDRARQEQRRAAEWAREDRKRFAERQREGQKRWAEQAREEQKRAHEQQREARKAFAENGRREAEHARQAQNRAAEHARRAQEERGRQERRWAEANARNAAAQERGGGGGGWKAEGGGGPKPERGGHGGGGGGGGPKADHGGGHGGGGGPKADHGGGKGGGNGKGGGKKD